MIIYTTGETLVPGDGLSVDPASRHSSYIVKKGCLIFDPGTNVRVACTVTNDTARVDQLGVSLASAEMRILIWPRIDGGCCCEVWI